MKRGLGPALEALVCLPAIAAVPCFLGACGVEKFGYLRFANFLGNTSVVLMMPYFIFFGVVLFVGVPVACLVGFVAAIRGLFRG